MVNMDDVPPLLDISSYIKSEAVNFQKTALGGKYVSLHWRFEKTKMGNVPKLVPAVLAAVDINMNKLGTKTVRSCV
jgi:hypothetical protein